MKTTEKSCQKLSKMKLEDLLKRPQITENDICRLSKEDQLKFQKHFNEEINTSTKENYHDRLYKYYNAVPEEVKNQLWDKNHHIIIESMRDFIRSTGTIPSKTHLATASKLSRNTIQKHLDRYLSSPQKQFYTEIKTLTEELLLSSLLKLALNGNIKAARLYMEATGIIKSKSNAAQNFIQINQTIIHQSSINNLPENLIEKVESDFKSLLSKSV